MAEAGELSDVQAAFGALTDGLSALDALRSALGSLRLRGRELSGALTAVAEACPELVERAGAMRPLLEARRVDRALLEALEGQTAGVWRELPRHLGAGRGGPVAQQRLASEREVARLTARLSRVLSLYQLLIDSTAPASLPGSFGELVEQLRAEEGRTRGTSARQLVVPPRPDQSLGVSLGAAARLLGAAADASEVSAGEQLVVVLQHPAFRKPVTDLRREPRPQAAQPSGLGGAAPPVPVELQRATVVVAAALLGIRLEAPGREALLRIHWPQGVEIH